MLHFSGLRLLHLSGFRVLYLSGVRVQGWGFRGLPGAARRPVYRTRPMQPARGEGLGYVLGTWFRVKVSGFRSLAGLLYTYNATCPGLGFWVRFRYTV